MQRKGGSQVVDSTLKNLTYTLILIEKFHSFHRKVMGLHFFKFFFDYRGRHYKGIIIYNATEVNIQQKLFKFTNMLILDIAVMLNQSIKDHYHNNISVFEKL
jgi:hypothetical protein